MSTEEVSAALLVAGSPGCGLAEDENSGSHENLGEDVGINEEIPSPLCIVGAGQVLLGPRATLKREQVGPNRVLLGPRAASRGDQGG